MTIPNYKNSYKRSGTLAEVGTEGNSLSEAMYSAYLFADALADYLLDE